MWCICEFGLIDFYSSHSGQNFACILLYVLDFNFCIMFLGFFFVAEHEKSLEDDVCGDTSGMFQRVLVSLLTVSKHKPTTSPSLDQRECFNGTLLEIL